MPKKGNNPKGVGSSIISIIIFLMILFVPFLGVNLTQRIRQGDGKFDFDEEICFDINDEKDFDDGFTAQPSRIGGTGAFANIYDETTLSFTAVQQKIIMLDLPLNGTVDGYGISTAKLLSPTDDPDPQIAVQIALNFTKEQILDLDITRIDVYFDLIGAPFNTINLRISDNFWFAGNSVSLGSISLGNSTKISISVIELIEINAFDSSNLILWFETNIDIPDNTPMIFDMQFYCIPEIITPSLTKISLWIAGTALFVIFMGFIVTPEVSFAGIAEWIGKRIGGGS